MTQIRAIAVILGSLRWLAFASIHAPMASATESSIQATLRCALAEAQARRLAKENPEVLALALFAASRRIAELQGLPQGQQPSPLTPSGMVPVYTAECIQALQEARRQAGSPRRSSRTARQHRRTQDASSHVLPELRRQTATLRSDALAMESYKRSKLLFHDRPFARRLTKRLRKYAEYLFTFLDFDHVPFENNFAGRQIRPAVILRKNGRSIRTAQGAATQSVLMSVYRTLRLRGLDPTKTIADALKTYLVTRQLPPPLPA